MKKSGDPPQSCGALAGCRISPCLDNRACQPPPGAAVHQVGDFLVVEAAVDEVALAGDGGVAVAGLGHSEGGFGPRSFAKALGQLQAGGVAVTGDRGCAQAGAAGVARALDGSMAYAHSRGTAMVGSDSRADAGEHGVAFGSGYRCCVTSQAGVAYCLHDGSASVLGAGGAAMVESGTARTDGGGVALVRSAGASNAGPAGVAIAWDGNAATASAGAGGVIILGYTADDGTYHLAVGVIGQNGLQPDVPYKALPGSGIIIPA